MHGRMVSAHDWVMRSPPLLPACQFERYEAELLAFHSSLGDVKTYVALRTPMIKDEDNSGTMRRLWGGGRWLAKGGVSHPSPMPLERTEGHTPPLPRARRSTRARVDHRADQQGPRGQARQGRRHGLRCRGCLGMLRPRVAGHPFLNPSLLFQCKCANLYDRIFTNPIRSMAHFLTILRENLPSPEP